MLPHVVDISAKLQYEVLTSDGGRSGKFSYLVKAIFLAKFVVINSSFHFKISYPAHEWILTPLSPRLEPFCLISFNQRTLAIVVALYSMRLIIRRLIMNGSSTSSFNETSYRGAGQLPLVSPIATSCGSQLR